ncbi:MAG TPA: hypothetical protein VNO14_05300 [Blastocatellia bacterium]|nr:hypothetical protein [Blastocatellia bacterium]
MSLPARKQKLIKYMRLNDMSSLILSDFRAFALAGQEKRRTEWPSFFRLKSEVRGLPLTSARGNQLHAAAHCNGADGEAPGLVTMIGPGNPLQIPPFNFILLKVFDPVWRALNFTFLGDTPPTVTVAPCLMLLPITARANPPAAVRFNLQDERTATSAPGPGVGVVEEAQVKVT